MGVCNSTINTQQRSPAQSSHPQSSSPSHTSPPLPPPQRIRTPATTELFPPRPPAPRTDSPHSDNNVDDTPIPKKEIIPIPIPTLEPEPYCSYRGVIRQLSTKKAHQLFQDIQESSIRKQIEPYMSQIQSFIENNLSHRCSRGVIVQNATLDFHYTAPTKHGKYPHFVLESTSLKQFTCPLLKNDIFGFDLGGVVYPPSANDSSIDHSVPTKSIFAHPPTQSTNIFFKRAMSIT